MFASDSAAAMTTAASADWGRSASRLLRKRSSTDDETRADEARELRLGAGLLGDRGARAARRDREPLEEAGGDVRGAHADHLLVGLQLVAASCREARRRRDGVGERHEHDADRRHGERADVVERRPRERRRREALRQGPDGRDAISGEVERRRHDRRAGHRDQHRRDARHDARQDEQNDEHPRADQRAPPPGSSSRFSKNARSSSTKPSASVENPNSFGSWLTTIVIARPFM